MATYNHARAAVKDTAKKIENAVENTYDSAKEKVELGLAKLKHANWSAYEEEALRFGLSFVNYMSTPLIERPFLNLMILQQLDNHSPHQAPLYNGYSEGFRKIIADEGFKGLFKGLWPQFIYELTKFGFRISTLGFGLRYIPDRYLNYDYLPFVVAGVEMASETVAYPLKVVSTRMVAQKGNTKYTGVVDCLEKIAVENESTTDLNPFKPEWYAGFGAHCLGLLAYAGTEVLARYAFDKAFGMSGDVVNVLNVRKFRPAPTVRFDADRNEVLVDHSVQVRDVDYAFVLRNPLCYAVAYFASYPFTLVATRQQAGDRDLKDKNAFEALQFVADREGVKGLWKGLFSN